MTDILKFNCIESDTKDACDILTSQTVDSEVNRFESVSRKYSDVIQIGKYLHLVIPSTSTQFYIYTSAVDVEYDTKCGLWYVFDIYNDMGGMLGPIIAKTSNDNEKCIITCTTTGKYKILDLAYLLNPLFNPRLPTGSNGDFYIHNTECWVWDADGNRVEHEIVINKNEITSVWNAIMSQLNLYSFVFDIKDDGIELVETIDDVVITQGVKSITIGPKSMYKITMVYTPKPYNGEFFPVITSIPIVHCDFNPNLDASHVDVMTPLVHVFEKSEDNKFDTRDASNLVTNKIHRVFTKISSIPNCDITNVAVPGLSNIVVFQYKARNDGSLSFDSFTLSKEHLTELNCTGFEKFSDVGVVNTDAQDQTQRFYFAPRYATKIYSGRIVQKDHVIDQLSTIDVPNTNKALASLGLFNNSITYNVPKNNTNNYHSNAIVFVPDHAQSFLSITNAHDTPAINWIIPNNDVPLNDGMKSIDDTKFKNKSLNYRMFDLATLDDDVTPTPYEWNGVLYNVYGGMYPKEVVIAIEMDTSTNPPKSRIVIGVNPVQVENHYGSYIYDEIRKFNILIPSYSNKIKTDPNASFKSDVEMCNFFEFNTFESYLLTRHYLRDNPPHPITTNQFVLWKTTFINVLKSKHIDMRSSKCLVLKEILYTSDATNNLTKYIGSNGEVPSFAFSLIEACCGLGKDTLNWVTSEGARDLYNAFGTEQYEAANDLLDIFKYAMRGSNSGIITGGWCAEMAKEILKCPDEFIIEGKCVDWGYDDESYINAVKEITGGSDEYKKKVLKIISCWRHNLASEAFKSKLQDYCFGDEKCVQQLEAKYDPMCWSSACQNDDLGIGAYQLLFKDDCNVDLNIANCNFNLDGSYVGGSVQCDICQESTICEGGGSGGGGGEEGTGSNKKIIIIVIIVAIVILFFILILVLNNKKTTKRLNELSRQIKPTI
jgi:hypothetical protein